MSDSYDFPVRWHRELIAKARKDLADIERTTSKLKNPTNYHRGFRVVLAMRKASLEAMLAIPEPQPNEVHIP